MKYYVDCAEALENMGDVLEVIVTFTRFSFGSDSRNAFG
jgi:hypothetical protein